MGYNFPNSEPNAEPDSDQKPPAGVVGDPVLKNLWEVFRAGVGGLGSSVSFESWLRDRQRSKRGLPPARRPGRGPINWLTRQVLGK